MEYEIKNGELKLKRYRMNLVYPASYMGRPNVQLEDQKTFVQQHRQPSVDNQNVLTAEEAHWHDAFVTFKSDFKELEKKLDDTKKELEEVHADLVMVMQELDLAKAELRQCVRASE